MMARVEGIAGTRFDFAPNLAKATHYDGWADPFWPPTNDYRLTELEIGHAVHRMNEAFEAELATLRELVEASWNEAMSESSANLPTIPRAAQIAEQLRRIAALLTRDEDRSILEMRADALEGGYNDRILADLAAGQEDFSFVAGAISTWYGKRRQGLPTAFGCRIDCEQQAAVDAAAELCAPIEAYLRALHAALRPGDVPAFAACRLFFMAGEGNRHPKHIA